MLDHRRARGWTLALVLLVSAGARAQPTPQSTAPPVEVRDAATDARPLPEMAGLLEQVQANQEALEATRADYTYTKTVTEREVDDRGLAKEKDVRTYEVFRAAGKPVEKLVARNGQPLPPKEARKEEKRVEKEIRDRNQQRAKQAQKGEDDDDLTVADIVRVCQFVNGRREPFRGDEAVVYDFEPRPGAKPRGRAESWIRRLQGTVWIDEHARQIVRLEARVNESIKLGGGLVLSLRPGSSLVFEQALVNGEVWLPSHAEVKLSARFLLLKGIKVNQTQSFSDYRKFEIETSSEMKPLDP